MQYNDGIKTPPIVQGKKDNVLFGGTLFDSRLALECLDRIY